MDADEEEDEEIETSHEKTDWKLIASHFFDDLLVMLHFVFLLPYNKQLYKNLELDGADGWMGDALESFLQSRNSSFA